MVANSIKIILYEIKDLPHCSKSYQEFRLRDKDWSQGGKFYRRHSDHIVANPI